MERRLDYDTLAHTAKRKRHGRGRRFAAARRCWFGYWTHAHDCFEETGPLLWAGAMGRVGGVVEAPDGSHALLAVFGESGAEGKVVVPLQHLFALGEFLAAVRGGAERRRMRKSGLGDDLGITVVRIRRVR